VDLETQTVVGPGFEAMFRVPPFTRECMLKGWDDIALTLRVSKDIEAYEAGRSAWMPRIGG